MPMSIPELERALRSLRLSGMTATLQADNPRFVP